MASNDNVRKHRIMIVDDSEYNRELLTEILGNDYEYIYANDGVTALDMLSRDERADVLLLDMFMPKMGGLEVLKLMKARKWTEEIPVVIISEDEDGVYIREAYNLGARDYIVRPFDGFLVQLRVKNILQQAEQTHRLAGLLESQILKREKMNNILINIFSNIVEMRNSESGCHTLRIQIITKMLLESLIRSTDRYSFSDEEISMISTVSALHDIGKAAIPKDILNKPGPLTAEEWEIMKSHTVRGDEFLQNVYADDTEKIMVFAHQVCRSHHERYDGKGYPDGLCGDEIPIAAQVVSIADVYDALTSDRCYKKAYSHAQALEMICNGECGAFNPLLIECLQTIADDLPFTLLAAEKNDYNLHNSLALTREVLYNEEIRIDERSHRLAEYETKKKQFFSTLCGGIQFEYDVSRRQVSYMHYYNSHGDRIHLPAEATHLLKDDDMKTLEEEVRAMTPDNDTLTKNVLVAINGDLRWHRLTVRGIWGKSGGMYKYVVGFLRDIQNDVLTRVNSLVVKGKYVSGEGIIAMRKLFEVVRLVNPFTHQIYKVDEGGDLLIDEGNCFAFYNKGTPCKNCIATKAFKCKHWTSKLEMRSGRIYTVISRRVIYKETDCVLQIAFNMDESIEKSKDEIGYNVFDAGAFKNYYRDTVTRIYSRAYLDTFREGFEAAKAVAMIDLDRFKKINDKHGHLVGDEALKHVANLVGASVRKEDELIRYGGDEFLLVFFDISEKDFCDKLQSIKATVNGTAMEKYPDVEVRISIGGVYDVHPFKKAVELADKAMYKDKYSARAETPGGGGHAIMSWSGKKTDK